MQCFKTLILNAGITLSLLVAYHIFVNGPLLNHHVFVIRKEVRNRIDQGKKIQEINTVHNDFSINIIGRIEKLEKAQFNQ